MEPYGGSWGYEECPRCGRFVVPSAVEVHEAKYHSGASGTVLRDDAGFDSPPPPSQEERMKRVLSDDQVWGK